MERSVIIFEGFNHFFLGFRISSVIFLASLDKATEASILLGKVKGCAMSTISGTWPEGREMAYDTWERATQCGRASGKSIVDCMMYLTVRLLLLLLIVYQLWSPLLLYEHQNHQGCTSLRQSGQACSIPVHSNKLLLIASHRWIQIPISSRSLVGAANSRVQ